MTVETFDEAKSVAAFLQTKQINYFSPLSIQVDILSGCLEQLDGVLRVTRF